VGQFRWQQSQCTESLAARSAGIPVAISAEQAAQGTSSREARSAARGFPPAGAASLKQRLVETGGRLVKHARYYWLLLAEESLSRGRFERLLTSQSFSAERRQWLRVRGVLRGTRRFAPANPYSPQPEPQQIVLQSSVARKDAANAQSNQSDVTEARSQQSRNGSYSKR
jgi:hypothetical protein